MQYAPTNVNLNYPSNTYANRYPPINQPQYGTGNISQSYESPPLHVSYPPQSIGGYGYVAPKVQYYRQTPLYPQQHVVIVPTYRLFWMNDKLTTITSNLKAFFIISGIIYTIWSLAIISLEIAITMESYWTPYHSVLINGFILGGGIGMLIVACRTSYPMLTLIKVFDFCLLFCLLGFILSAINYGKSTKCSSWYSSNYSCDKELVSILKIVSLIIYIAVIIHTLINIIVFSNIHKKTVRSAVSNVSNH